VIRQRPQHRMASRRWRPVNAMQVHRQHMAHLSSAKTLVDVDNTGGQEENEQNEVRPRLLASSPDQGEPWRLCFVSIYALVG
jgi:hypothetical protein